MTGRQTQQVGGKRAAGCAVALAAVSVVLTLSLFSFVAQPAPNVDVVCASIRPIHVDQPADSYSYEGLDVPSLAPGLRLGQPVELTVEESVHYSLDEPEAAHEWLQVSPVGTGIYALGPRRRGFFVSMFHQLHCLRYIRSAYTDEESPSKAHMQHCINYMRQAILCQADLTLEPGNFAQRNFTIDRVGQTHVCRDWDGMYDVVGRNWLEVVQAVEGRNVSGSGSAQS
ncbi:hypothetical protein FA95DRAFT_1601266 [Auriscalpium vulgare]|uniref:Uncharacterized protein n=1 Tax=Auriscalpium vulgare TaxID=40419 RepID=A0ACB8SBE7_9AGAM|nr:hypothetical protein FA95DRAFT_1601266 [Auriscalpium vulgare]